MCIRGGKKFSLWGYVGKIMLNSILTKRWFFGRSCVNETNRIQKEYGWFILVSMVGGGLSWESHGWWNLANFWRATLFLFIYMTVILADWSGVYFSSHDLHIISHLWKCDCTCFFILETYLEALFLLFVNWSFHVLWKSGYYSFELNYLVHHFDHYFSIFFKRVIIFINTFQIQITWGRLENPLVQSDQNNKGEDMCQTDFVE